MKANHNAVFIAPLMPDDVKEVVLESAFEAYKRAEVAFDYSGDLDLLKQESLHFKTQLSKNKE